MPAKLKAYGSAIPDSRRFDFSKRVTCDVSDDGNLRRAEIAPPVLREGFHLVEQRRLQPGLKREVREGEDVPEGGGRLAAEVFVPEAEVARFTPPRLLLEERMGGQKVLRSHRFRRAGSNLRFPQNAQPEPVCPSFPRGLLGRGGDHTTPVPQDLDEERSREEGIQPLHPQRKSGQLGDETFRPVPGPLPLAPSI